MKLFIMTQIISLIAALMLESFIPYGGVFYLFIWKLSYGYKLERLANK